MYTHTHIVNCTCMNRPHFQTHTHTTQPLNTHCYWAYRATRHSKLTKQMSDVVTLVFTTPPLSFYKPTSLLWMCKHCDFSCALKARLTLCDSYWLKTELKCYISTTSAWFMSHSHCRLKTKVKTSGSGMYLNTWSFDPDIVIWFSSKTTLCTKYVHKVGLKLPK